MGFGGKRLATLTHANTDQGEVSTGQGSAAVLPPDQAYLIGVLIRVELCRGMGRRSCRSEREGISSSPSSQEGSRLSQSRCLGTVLVFCLSSAQ